MFKQLAALLILAAWPLASHPAAQQVESFQSDSTLTPDVQDNAQALELIQRGRHFLDLREADEALVYFERARQLAPDSINTRLWQLRAWMDLGRSNDTLDAIDELRNAGHEGVHMEYLYGMAFLRRAQGMIAAGVTDSSPRMNFEDAAFRLLKALKLAPESYPDAYQALAIAAWFNSDLTTARWASEQAIQHFPWSPRAWLQLGRVAMSQFSAARGEADTASWSPETSAFLERAKGAFGRAIEALGEPLEDASAQRLLSDAGIQLGHALIWEAEREQASRAYALGISWSPEAVDYRQIQAILAPSAEAKSEPDLFHLALESGAAHFQENFGPDDPRDATLLWWLGWERLSAHHAVGSELAFLASVHKNPEFVNTWFYVALARFDARNYAGGAEALEQGWMIDSNVMIDSVLSDKPTNIWILRQALDQLNASKPFLDADDNRHAAMLSRVIAEAEPNDGWNWNNLGMFVRDQADALVFSGRSELNDAEISSLHEKSYQAYLRALDLLPGDPGVVNDTAVLLHYYLKRNPAEALEMYARATHLAEAALLSETLEAQEQERLETALRDSIENARILVKELAESGEVPVGEPVLNQ